MNILNLRLLFPLVFILLLLGCSSSKQKKEDETAVNDTLRYQIPIPPGNAAVRGLVLNIDSTGDEPVYQIRIVEVFEYGASTPVLPAGTELRLYTRPGLSEEERKILSVGNETGIQISHIRGMGDLEYWSLVKFIHTQ